MTQLDRQIRNRLEHLRGVREKWEQTPVMRTDPFRTATIRQLGETADRMAKSNATTPAGHPK